MYTVGLVLGITSQGIVEHVQKYICRRVGLCVRVWLS